MKRTVAASLLLMTAPHAHDAKGLCRAVVTPTLGLAVGANVSDPVAIAMLDAGSPEKVVRAACPSGGTVPGGGQALTPTLAAVVNGSPTQLQLGSGLTIGTNGVLNAVGGLPASTVTASCATAQSLVPGNAYAITLTGNCALSFAGVPAGAGSVQAVTVALQQDAAAGRVPALPAGVRWPGGVAPTPNSAAGRIDVFTFRTLDGGTTWFGGN